MVQNTMLQTLGSSLRELAAVVDALPALEGAIQHPSIPRIFMLQVRTPLAVKALARDLALDAHTETHDGNEVTSFEVQCGTVLLRVYSLASATRELHRPTDLTERIEAAL